MFINDKKIIPEVQFDSRIKHFTIHQIYCQTYAIAYSYENKLYCLAVLLNVDQDFNKVRHTGFLFKLKELLSFLLLVL